MSSSMIGIALLTLAVGAFAGDAAGNGGGRGGARIQRWLDCAKVPQVEERLRASGYPVFTEYNEAERAYRAKVQCYDPHNLFLPLNKAAELGTFLDLELGAVSASVFGHCYLSVTFGRETIGALPDPD